MNFILLSHTDLHIIHNTNTLWRHLIYFSFWFLQRSFISFDEFFLFKILSEVQHLPSGKT